MQDLENIVEKIKKLHAHAESAKAIGSDHEAATFAAAVQNMLRKHQLSLTDIQFEEQRKSEPVERSRVNWKEHGVQRRNKRVQWIEDLAGFVAAAHNCRILVVVGSSTIVLVGTETNRKIAEFVLVTLVRSAERLAQKAYDTYYYKCQAEGDVTRAQGFKASFLSSFILRIRQRYAEAEAELRRGETFAIVRVQQQERDVLDFMKQFKGRASSLSRFTSDNAAGWTAGRKAADAVDLRGDRGIETNDPNKQLR